MLQFITIPHNERNVIMKLLVIILNKTECLEELLEAFSENNISGATIIDSKGML